MTSRPSIPIPKALTEGPLAWRERLTERLLRAFLVLFVVSGLLISLGVQGSHTRHALGAIALLGGTAMGIAVLTGRPIGAVRAWFVIAPPLTAAIGGFAIVGYLSGPGVLLTLTLMLSGLLLGSRAMIGLTIASAVALSTVVWAMVTGHLQAPDPRNVAMTSAIGWARTLGMTFLGIGLFGGLMVAVVTRMEGALERLGRETSLREQAERERTEAELMALEARQLENVGRLAAGVAHDFNNSLTAIIGAAELLKLELGEKHPTADLTQTILQASRRAAELTHQLLAYSRRAQMVQSPHQLHRIIEEAVSLVRRSMHPNIRLVTKLDALNPIVLADATLLQNALLNLLVNACDAMPKGGTLTVCTTPLDLPPQDGTNAVQPGVLVEVIDTGNGISGQVLPEIFSPFVTTKPLGKGTGLGLAAVAGTVKAHGGRIEVESELGVGSSFRLYLPCSAAEATAAPTGGSFVVRGEGELILIDDDVMVSLTAIATLKSFGYSVTHATDGASGIELVRADPRRFRLVLLDLRMPGLSGEATFEKLRELAPDLPVLLWSGYSAEQDVNVMLTRGAAGFVQKPYRVVELSRIIADTLGARTSATRHDGAASSLAM